MTTALVKYEFGGLAKDTNAIISAIKENLGGAATNAASLLDRVKVPAGGGSAWEVPGLSNEVQKALTGVVIAFQDARVYWEKGLDERKGKDKGTTEPDCFSADGERGIGKPGGECAVCPLAEFGSGKGGRGQACKQNRLLFLLRSDDCLPLVVKLPPSSLQNIRKYFLRLSNRGLKYYNVVTRLELEKAQNPDGIAYSKVVPSFEGALDEESLVKIESYAKAIQPYIMRAAVDDDE